MEEATVDGEPRTVGKAELTLRIEPADDETIVISAYGALDLASAGLLGDELEAAEEIRRVIVDFGELTFIDSTGLHMLMTATKHSSDGGPDIRLRRVSGEVGKIIDVAGLTEYLPLGDRQ